MYPANYDRYLKNLKTFTPPEVNIQSPTDQEPGLPRTPKKPIHVEESTWRWQHKVTDLLSSPSRPEFVSFLRGTRQVTVESTLQTEELNILSQQRKDEIESKKRGRK